MGLQVEQARQPPHRVLRAPGALDRGSWRFPADPSCERGAPLEVAFQVSDSRLDPISEG